jgi:rhodanese-related sulfurtransferase
MSKSPFLPDLKLAGALLAFSCVVGAAHYLVRSTVVDSPLPPGIIAAGAETEGGATALDLASIGETLTFDQMRQVVREKADVLILDVRPDYFYNMGHIPGAVNLERGEFGALYPSLKERVANAKRVVVYCSDSGCKDSKAVARLLREAGHKYVSLYPGGWKEWEQQEQNTKILNRKSNKKK